MKEEPACILIVDDNELNRDLLARRLEKVGHDVVIAENGRVALDKLAAFHIDIILLDIMMPVLNGFELLPVLKNDPKLQIIPVIVISAADDTDSIVRSIQLGAEDYLPKPFNLPLLKARINACLSLIHI